MQSEAMLVEDETTAQTALSRFWSTYRLQHKETELREWLGTESMIDLDDVFPCDLRTLRATQWLEATFSVAEANRLRKAVEEHNAQMLAAADAAAGFAEVWDAGQKALARTSGCENVGAGRTRVD
jgi:hypothetical protein